MVRRRALRPVAELLARFFGSDARHRYFKRWVALWFILAATVSTGLSVDRYVSFLRAAENVQWVEHTHTVLYRLRMVAILLDHMRQTIAETEALERRSLVLRSQAAALSRKSALAFFGLGTTANILILVLAFLSFSREIGRRNAMEQELRQSQQRFENSFEAATVGKAVVDINGKWLEVNRSFCEIVGFSKEELLAGNSRPLADADDLDDLLICAREVLERNLSTYQIEKPYIQKSGKLLRIALGISLIRDDAGQPFQFVIALDDVTARKQAEEGIYREQQRYLGLVEATGSIVWNTLPSGEVEHDQPAWSSFSGQSADEVRGSGWLTAIHPDDRAHTLRIWSVALAHGSKYEVEHRVRGRNGVYRYMLARAVPIRAGDGSIEEWVGVHSDIDDQKRSHVEMRQAKEAAEAARARPKGSSWPTSATKFALP
jgi:PAS domain S-box-containing protein